MERKLCLLRGINVGGKNIIKMSNLKLCFEKMGLLNVETYIQSGNVLFNSGKANSILTSMLEKSLYAAFSYTEPLLVMSAKKLESIIASSPDGFGDNPELFRYDVIYMIKGMTTKKFAKIVVLKEGVDTMSVGKDAVYFSRLISKASKSQLSRIMNKPEYKSVTIRNWNTTLRLADKL
ncbi:MAG: DUF1697 domain-containing protein [Deltaproteobacteria bacterium]|nr:DUF1697 domain-containing protein [Deltaproteobacteria bacterium]